MNGGAQEPEKKPPAAAGGVTVSPRKKPGTAKDKAATGSPKKSPARKEKPDDRPIELTEIKSLKALPSMTINISGNSRRNVRLKKKLLDNEVADKDKDNAGEGETVPQGAPPAEGGGAEREDKDPDVQIVATFPAARLPDPVEAGSLKAAEEGVLASCRSLEGSLFKLSAYMSQFSREIEDLKSAQSLADTLRQRLAEVEQTVGDRKDKVDSLRSVIKGSHQEVLKCRKDIAERKDACLRLGQKLHGPKYAPPTPGDSIQRKLVQIQATAQLVKSSNSADTAGAEKKGEEGAAALPATIEKVKKEEEKEKEKEKEEMETSGDAGSATTAAVIGQEKNVPPSPSPPPPPPQKQQPSETRPEAGGSYSSTLEHLRPEEEGAARMDPHTILCRFEMAGTCRDDSCEFQHCLK